MNYTFHQLKVFIAVVDNKSITKAAQALNMTQPAVSIQLKNLQEQFDIPLTEVIGRKLYVTVFGHELYAIAIKVVEELANITYRTQSFKGMLSGKLKISVASTGKYVMPYYLKGFLKIYPDIDLVMDVTNKTHVIKSISNNEVDFALVSVLPEHLEIEQEVLLPNKLYLTAAADTTIDQPGKLNESVFSKIPLIYREEGSGTRVTMQQYFREVHVVPTIKLELTSSEAVKQAVLAGLGFSIQSILSIKNELKQEEIKIIPVKGLPLTENWRLIWLKQKKMSIVASAFLDYTRQQKSAIYKDHFSWIEQY
ncbi:LysR family transcriptional regulator [Segetibacter sp. 3557_3]|uniref:LysR family transcriptional regulator n=1 Tax=Segetibacter sp. 3557_3 TaxID=2547429 RepID=UPI00105843D3|nr:LysR family transcriptional regulator [Segetibacter sp. 3557_3]TDH27006.1 LysR family transcriptional regulator [Segetibacter sp. 3557_3]